MKVPPLAVLEAFGLTGPPEALSGGRGGAWRAGHAILKPWDGSIRELEWHAETLGAFSRPDLRVARPLRAANGALLVEGWAATGHLSGRHEAGRWTDILRAGQRLHEGLSGIPRPAFLDDRADSWAVADRVAWGELPLEPFVDAPHVRSLARHLRPVTAPFQVVHGDLTGNVLFGGGAPAVIDFTPYWRPTGYASAIVVADAVVWEGADEGLLETARRDEPDFAQCLLRALIFRRVTEELLHPGAPPAPDPYGRIVTWAVSHAEAG